MSLMDEIFGGGNSPPKQNKHAKILEKLQRELLG